MGQGARCACAIQGNKSPVNFTGVPGHQIDGLWPALETFFNQFEGLSDGEWTADEIRAECESGLRQCWIAYDAAVVAVTITGVHKDVLDINFCVGSRMEEWCEKKLDFILEWARSKGAGRWRITGRPGWIRLFRGRGLKEAHRVYIGEL